MPPPSEADSSPSNGTLPASAWWFDAFPSVPYQSPPPGAHEMLTLVAYDVTQPKRLARVARVCEDFGVRVQYSLFECRLEEPEFDEFWLRLLEEIDEKEDRLVAYKIDARSAKQTLTAGTMVCSQKAVCYVV